MLWLLSLAVFALLCAAGAVADERVADWVSVQSGDASRSGTVVYHKTFKLDFDAQEAEFKFTCYTPTDFGGTHYRSWINNVAGPSGSFWQDVQYVSPAKVLRVGDNEIDIEVAWEPMGMPGPILAKLDVKGKDKDGKDQSVTVRTDDSWEYHLGRFDISGKALGGDGMKKVSVVAPADKWEQAKNPEVLPKIDTSTMVGVSDVTIKGGNAGSLYQFNLVRDYSDKFYFLKALGYSSIEDYIFGQTNYQYPGAWFWGYDREIQHSHEVNGFDFTVYPWVWVPAEWYRKREQLPMVRCIEHGQEGFGLSLWSPLLEEFNENVYSELQANFGDTIRAIYPGIYGDFGEAHYMAGWNPWMQPKPEHEHAGFWAGDDLARADFRAKMLKKYGTLDALNAAWHTAFASADEIAYPALDGSAPRRYTLDFVNWYYDCMTEFTAKVCGIARKHFPNIPIAPKLGCGDENPMWGQDNSAIPEALAKIGVGVRSTHGSSPNFAVRRISSACKFYGNRFETETAGGTDRQDAAKKFFIDASSGCSEVFEYPDAMLRVADIFSNVRRNLRGEHSITSVALFFPTSWHRLNLKQGYPPKLAQAAEELRDYTDFDVVDENMILDGALAKYRALVMFDGNLTEQAVYDAIDKWVRSGGSLLLRSEQLPFTNVEGELLPISGYAEEARSGGAIHEQGRGQIIIWDGTWDERSDYYEVVWEAAYPGSLGGGIDCKKDGVWTSLFKDRLLYLNTTDAPVTVSEGITEAFARQSGLSYSPRFLRYNIEVPAHGQAVHLLDKPFAEFALECEKMAGAEKLPTEAIYRGGYGTPGSAVRIHADNRLQSAITVNDDTEFGLYCIAEPVSGGAWVEVDGKRAADITGPSGPHDYMYPRTITLHLKRGRHTISLRTSGELLADKVMVTTDTGLAGFAYGFIDPKADQAW